ncbi:hypothetical protein [Elstera cyanobacteriorum]|uniref:hypothetical protein n=1 Tax=Elstera cyanobacteriorum TaxID=2022747 RepID=UPI002356A4AA|nr:hypothetical protein [Elstera cyanobacteriorum]MCK6443576.1 hypothetical protein [Elstera cyanobacteriorum]
MSSVAQAADAAFADHPLPETACFAVSALADPGMLHRLLEPFAKRGLVPSAVYARQHGEDLSVDIQIDGLTQTDAAMIGRGMRQIFGVDVVLVSQRVSA